MSERTRLLYSVLSHPWVYSTLQNLLGANSSRRTYLKHYARISPGDRILDIGCGPADILALLPPEVDYLGFDMNNAYIEDAKKRFGNRGRFFCAEVTQHTLQNEAPFDLIMANGLIHHLDDEQTRDLFTLAINHLKPDGKMLTIDGCYTKDQPTVTRFILSRDRGQYVRNAEEYQALAGSIFPRVETDIRSDLLTIPYTHIIMTLRR